MIQVLLADDQALIREGIRQLLTLSGEIEVIAEADEGTKALELIRAKKPQVALLDVRMPGLTGVEVTQRLQKLGDPTPVILLTTFDDDTALLDGVRAGIKGHLLKDIGSAQLLEAIRTVSQGGTLILPALTQRAETFVKGAEETFEAAAMPDTLTDREAEVLRLLAGGYSNREIADALGMVEGTAKNHVSNILSKLGVRDRTRAVLKAIALGWLTSPR